MSSIWSRMENLIWFDNLISIPADKMRTGVKDLNLLGDVRVENPLGIQWNIAKDSFYLNIKIKRRNLTKRVMLSIISSTYDPLGFTGPFVLEGMQPLQNLCNQNVQWDETVNEELKSQWIKWEMKLKQVGNLHIWRCLRLPGFGRIADISIHDFFDASEHRYGRLNYIRWVDTLLLVAWEIQSLPKEIYINPCSRVRSFSFVCESGMLIKDLKGRFWTNSQVVLVSIMSNFKRFKEFVANCIHQIKENTRVDQRHYFARKQNPADDASRGLDLRKETRVIILLKSGSFLDKQRQQYRIIRRWCGIEKGSKNRHCSNCWCCAC